MSINSDALILRETDNLPLTNKNDFINGSELDSNFIAIYNDFLSLAVTVGVDAYDGRTYDDTLEQYATYDARTWEWINGTPGNVTPGTSPTHWTEIFPTKLGHRKNSDTILAEGTANEVTAADIKNFIEAGDTTSTDLSLSSFTATSFQLNSSTGDDVVLPQATEEVAGLLNAGDKIKLNNVVGSNTGDQTLGSLGAEAVSNKATDFSTVNDTLYPSVQAVDVHVQTFANSKLDIELVANTQVDLNTYDLNFNDGSVTINNEYTFPIVDGAANQVMQTDGAGVVSWAAAPSTNLSNADMPLDRSIGRIATLGDTVNEVLIIENDSGDAILTLAGNQTLWSKGKGTGGQVTAFGELALNTVTAAQNNTAFGHSALKTLTGAGNTAIGTNAGKSTTVCQNGVFVGLNAGQAATGGSDMVFIGCSAGHNSLGSQRGTLIGTNAGFEMTTTNDNTMVGHYAGKGVTLGEGNVFLGHALTTASGITNGDYNVVIGNDVLTGNVSNNVKIADGQGNQLIRKDANDNQILGIEAVLATTATDGFTYLPTCAGVPTGVPTAVTGKVPTIIDSTNNKMYIYTSGAWVALN